MRTGSLGFRLGRLAFVSGLVASLASCAPVDATGAAIDPIVDGTLDNGDPAVYYMLRGDGAACTASLISPHVVLTARHCVVGSGDAPAAARLFTVYVGRDFRSFYGRYRVASVHIIPDSTGNISNGRAEDLGLLVLTTAADETPLVIDRESPNVLSGQDITAIGFGQTPSGRSGTKYTVVKSVERVQGGLVFVVPTVCSGDSGGPLVGPNGHVYGVASFIYSPDGMSEPECGTAPGAYNAIYQHLDWIDGVLEDAGDLCVPDEEVCDGMDNDCDGVVDQDCLPRGATCTENAECTGALCADTAVGRICTDTCDATRPLDACGADRHCVVSSGCEGFCVPGAPGTVGVGAACTSDAECESGNCDDPGDGRTRCLPLCRGDAAQCASGEACTGGPGACGACVPEAILPSVRGLGEECVANADCRSGFCVDRAGVRECGSPCSASGSCDEGFVCQSDFCVADRAQPPGGVCSDVTDCLGGTCAMQGDRHWCSPEDCSTVECPLGFSCVDVDASTHVCAPTLAFAGEACTVDAGCTTGLCVSGVCTTACSAANDCGAGLRCVRTADGSGAYCQRPAPAALGGGCSVGSSSGASRASLAILALAVAAVTMRRRRLAA